MYLPRFTTPTGAGTILASASHMITVFTRQRRPATPGFAGGDDLLGKLHSARSLLHVRFARGGGNRYSVTDATELSGSGLVFWVARQQATMTATPNAGQNFYAFINGPFWLAGGLGANPKTFYVPDSGLAINTTA